MRMLRPMLMGGIALVLLAGQSVGVMGQAEGASPAHVPVPSEGCGVSDVEAGILRGQTLFVGDDERRWSLYVPQAHDGTDPVPLWVQLHGKQGADVTAVALIASAAETHGFVLVGPNGNDGNPSWLWHKESDDVDLTRANPDIAFVEALVDHLGEMLCLDLTRVYAVGENQGGYFVAGLACVLEDRLAAVATVSGMLDLGERCELERSVPLLNVHSRNDTYALFDGGSGDHPAGLPLSGDGEPMLYGEHPIVKTYQSASIPTRTTGIAVRNGCEPEPTVEAIGDELERWAWDCPPGAEVELVTHGGGYRWPEYEALSITERIWEFFEQHPMPE